jgi:toxin ParE1/3/4
MQLLRHPGAEEDILEAARWYDAQRDALSEEFLDALEEVLIVVATRPRSFTQIAVPIVNHEVRRFVMKVYPYSVCYDIRPDHVVLIAVAHQRRQQDYWLNRLSP